MSKAQFVAALGAFTTDFSKVANREQDLLAQKEQLKTALNRIIGSANFAIADKNNMLLDMVNNLKSAMHHNIVAWDEKLQQALPMKALSEQYADRIIFLIFGKVNAGKSSFANFLTEQFPTEQVKRFRFHQGKVEYFTDNQTFAEGVTETTASIQGVELGRNFVLLDSPGLHSITDENGALTQQFVDSTDAVLWLTPSTSPGQVQELKDLQIELEKGKPLQPVITRSDTIEEEYCATADDIIACIQNKDKERRALQETDVLARIKDMGLNLPVKAPISISVHAYKQAGKTEQALNESGLTPLFERLVVLIDEAKAYKVGKANNQIVIFLEKEMLAPLTAEVLPQIDALRNAASQNMQLLEKKKAAISLMMVSDVLSEVPFIVNKYKDSQDKTAIAKELNQFIENKLNNVLQQELSAFVSEVGRVSSDLSGTQLGDFEDITIDIQQVSGSGVKAAAAGAGGIGGAIGGAELGTLIFPGPGTVIGGIVGGLLGGWLGSKGGDYLVQTETVTEKVGVSSERMIGEITKIMQQKLPSLVDTVVKEAIASIDSVKQFADAIANEIRQFEQRVATFKE